MAMPIFDIDGSMLEGGGQLLRLSVSLGALMKRGIRITNIRAGRKTPGLRPQHLAGVRLLADVTKAEVEGLEIGSTELQFYPGPIRGGNYSANTGTAGSVALLLQVALPCLLFADGPCTLNLSGGTNCEMAPQIDHTLMVFKPLLEKFNAHFDCEIVKRGYYPRGGGCIKVKVMPKETSLDAVTMLQPGKLITVGGRSFVAGVLPIKMSQIMAEAASKVIKSTDPLVSSLIKSVKEEKAEGNGSGIVLIGRTDTNCLLGGSSLGKKDLLPELVGRKAAQELLRSVGSCVDSFTQDQIIIFMALARGKSSVKTCEPTLHTKTAIKITELITGALFTITPPSEDTFYTISCEGIGLVREGPYE